MKDTTRWLGWCGWLNFLLLQWFFVRLAHSYREVRSADGVPTFVPNGFVLLRWIVPLTGWSDKPFRWVRL